MSLGIVYVSHVVFAKEWLGLTPVGVAGEPGSFGFDCGPEPWI